MVGLVHDTAHITTQSFKRAGDLVYLIGETNAEFGGSELQKMLQGSIYGKVPKIDLAVEKKRQNELLAAIQKGLVSSAHDLSEGGLAVALAECCFDSNGLGVNVTIRREIRRTALFAKHNLASLSVFLLKTNQHLKQVCKIVI